MKSIADFLEATSQMIDSLLEPTDETTYLVKVKNHSDRHTAHGVTATIHLVGTPIDGIKIVPQDRFLGSIPPNSSVTEEISIVTDRARGGTYKVAFHLNFTAVFDNHEVEETEFYVSGGC